MSAGPAEAVTHDRRLWRQRLVPARKDHDTAHVQVPDQVADTPHARSAAVVLACEHLCVHADDGVPSFPPLYDNRAILKKGAPRYAINISSMTRKEVAGMHAVVGESLVGTWETAVAAAGVAIPHSAAEVTKAIRWWLKQEDKEDLEGCTLGGRTLDQIRYVHVGWP